MTTVLDLKDTTWFIVGIRQGYFHFVVLARAGAGASQTAIPSINISNILRRLV